MKRVVLSGLVGMLLCALAGSGSLAWASLGKTRHMAATTQNQNFQIQYKLQKMGLSPAAARQAVWGAAYNRNSACREHVHQLLDDYTTLHPRDGAVSPSDEDMWVVNNHDGRYIADIETGHYCNRWELDQEASVARSEEEEKTREAKAVRAAYNPANDPDLVVAKFFEADRQGMINRLVKAGVAPILAENASRLIVARKGAYKEGAYKECAAQVFGVVRPSVGQASQSYVDAINAENPENMESVCGIAKMNQEPDVVNPYEPSINRLIKAFQEDSKGTIDTLVSLGVARKWAKGAARLIPPRKGRYRKCAIIMGGLLDNLHNGGEETAHVAAINNEYYAPDKFSDDRMNICDSSNKNVFYPYYGN